MADPVFGMRNLGGAVPEDWIWTTLTGMEGFTFYPTVQGSGSNGAGVDITCNFGPFDPTMVDVPTGCFPGWLSADKQNFTKFSPGSQYLGGSAQLTGDYGLTFPVVNGIAQTPDGWAVGGWFYQITRSNGGGSAQVDLGGGAGRLYDGGNGMHKDAWVQAAGYQPGMALGGGMASGNGAALGQKPRLYAIDTFITTSAENWNVGGIVEIALILSPFPPDFFGTPQNIGTARLTPIPLICVPCCPLGPCQRTY